MLSRLFLARAQRVQDYGGTSAPSSTLTAALAGTVPATLSLIANRKVLLRQHVALRRTTQQAREKPWTRVPGFESLSGRTPLPPVGFPLEVQLGQTRLCHSVYACMANDPPSRPMPLSLTPPNGVSGLRLAVLMPTFPDRSRLATAMPCAVSPLNT